MEKATGGISMDTAGAPPFSSVGFRNAIREIGRDKLEHLLGSDAVGRLNEILKTSREMKTSPGKVGGSDTSLNSRIMAERAIRHEAAKHLIGLKVPGLKSVLNVVKASKEAKAMKSSIDEALTPRRVSPEDIATGVSEARKLKRQREMQEAGAMARGVAPAYPAVVQSGDEEQ
jgi:hypothetical protein